MTEKRFLLYINYSPKSIFLFKNVLIYKNCLSLQVHFTIYKFLSEDKNFGQKSKNGIADRPFPLACRLSDSSNFSISTLLGFLIRPLADDFFPCLNLSILIKVKIII